MNQWAKDKVKTELVINSLCTALTSICNFAVDRDHSYKK